jgi:zinc and cadmium transporter
MLSIYLYTLTSVAIVSIVSFIGALFLFFSPETMKKIVMFLVSLSAGALLADATLHLIPEAIAEQGLSFSVWAWFMGGILVFFILEKIIHWHHCHLDPDHCDMTKTIGVVNLIGDGFHNFIDGAVIAGSFLISIPLGIATTVAVVAHEIPHEIGNFGVLIHAGYARGRALFLNFISALVAVAGALVTLLISSGGISLTDYIIPFTAGNFVYIATTDLIPELKHETKLTKSVQQLVGILLGIGIMLLLKKLG